MRILLHGLNYAPEEIGIGKYSGEMVQELAEGGHDVVVVTTPPYYPQWKILDGYRGSLYSREVTESVDSRGRVEVIRCPLWVPTTVSGLKRVIHLASFGLSSIPAVFWSVIRFRPDVVMTVEPAALCMPTTWIAARLTGAKAWLHVQDFEIDAAFELGILKQPMLKRFVLAAEAFLMRRFDRVSSISPNMLMKLVQKGVAEERVVAFPNWVDCDVMKPLEPMADPDADHSEVTDGTAERKRTIDSIRATFGIPTGKCVALYAGNIGAKQGLEIILDAARQTTRDENLHFVICGRGAAYDDLLNASRGLANVQFLPVQPMERFNELMNSADIHLLPQKADAADLVMPSKLTGMLATGRPIVACASIGTQIADVVDGHGIIVPPADSAAFCDAIVRLAGDRNLRETLGAAARVYAVKHLGRKSILAQFIRDLRQACSIGDEPSPVDIADRPGYQVRIDAAQSKSDLAAGDRSREVCAKVRQPSSL
ncbi:glycosyltransferase WbuB [Novipirellula sp.]|uniref:glycosyltransferase WbuB n=1 Tax=Novipirellula sp. TaxID=2795430 RepID=UPI003569A013